MKSYLVSALVSTYKSERFMRGLLEDLESQTIADRLEIVICDSNSPEDERAIVEEFQRRYNNIVYFRTPERENSHVAINRCIEAAHGKYLTVANADDRHRRDALEIMARALEQYPEYGAVYADSLLTHIENETFDRTNAMKRYDWPDFNLATALSTYLFGPQPMWRREVHEVAGRFDPDMWVAGDQDFFLRVAWKRGAVHLRETLGLFLQHPDANSGKKNLDRLVAETREIYRKYRRQIPIEDVYPALKNYADDPRAGAAALWDFGNLCALSPYPDFELAMATYEKAIEGAVAIPDMLDTLRAMLAVNGGVVSFCAGDRSRGRALLKSVGHLAAAQTNLQRMDEIERKGLQFGAVNFVFKQLVHDVVTDARTAAILCLTESGELAKSGTHEQIPWDVYEGPHGVPVSDEERARMTARKPRIPESAAGAAPASGKSSSGPADAVEGCPVALPQGDLDAAIVEYRKLAETMPEVAAAHTSLGTVLLASGRTEEAVVALRRATELSPEDPAGHNQLGVALHKMGDPAGAETAFKRARQADDNDVSARLNLVDLYRSQGDFPQATATLKEAVQRHPDNADVLATFASLNLELGGKDGAKRALQRLEASDPAHPAAAALRDALDSGDETT